MAIPVYPIESCKVKVKGNDQTKLVVINLNVSQGKLLTLMNALVSHGTPTALDLIAMLRNAAQNEPDIKHLVA